MPADLAQERDVFELAQPLVIVDHDRVGRPVAEGQEALEHLADAGDVGVDLLVGQQLAALVLAGRIADLGRPAAHQHDRLVARLLQPAQHHDLDQAADVQARRGRVEADVAGHDLPLRQGVEPCGVGQLMDVAALVEQLAGGRNGTRSCAPLSVMLSRPATAGRCSSTFVPHPATLPSEPGFKVWANVDHAAAFGAAATTNIWFGVGAPASRFVIPEADEPSRADELWQTTCFEAFLREAGADAYREWNFAPSGHWAAYDFSAVPRRHDRG